MSLIPTVYRSTDPGAPVLNGQAGSLIALLHAVLVTGYGSGQTAKPPAGWSRPYSNGDVHVYRNSPVSGSGSYLRVRDDASAPMLGTGRLAQALAYSSMSDIDSGQDCTPSPELQSQGSLIAKSPLQTAASRPWLMIATEIGFYLFTSWHNYPNGMGAYYYGDILSNMLGDVYSFAVFGSAALSGFSGAWSDPVCSLFYTTALNTPLVNAPNLGIASTGGYVMRGYSGGNNAPGRIETTGYPAVGGNSSRMSYGSGAFMVGPDPSHGGYNYIEAVVREAPFAIRGKLPGVIAPLHARPHAAGSVVPFVDGIGLGQWLVVNYNVAEPDTAARDGQVLFRTDVAWK
ncbi:MAG TPA: hypothetical protein DIW85_11710 [Stenotrophomonas sp.]|jgi:hypothetical protein|nr:hypothetical protein [Stenotrophomonas sp.]